MSKPRESAARAGRFRHENRTSVTAAHGAKSAVTRTRRRKSRMSALVARPQIPNGRIVSRECLGGLHHRYHRAA